MSISINAVGIQSLHTQLQAAQHALEHVAIQQQVSCLLSDLTTHIEHHHTIQINEQLQTRCASVTSATNHAVAEWTHLKDYLEREIQRVQKQESTLTVTRSELQTSHDILARELSDTQRVENMLMERRKRGAIKSDISKLPKIILRRIATYMTCLDVHHASGVCLRWRRDFERGFVWKTVAVGMVNRIIQRQKQAMQEKNKYPIANVTNVVVNIQQKGLFTPSKSKDQPPTVNKSELFALCLQQQHKLLHPALSEREDLASKASADVSVLQFLAEKVEKQYAEVGLARVEVGNWQQKNQALAVEKENIDRSIRVLDSTLRDERQRRTKIQQKYELEIATLQQHLKNNATQPQQQQQPQQQPPPQPQPIMTAESRAILMSNIDKLRQQKKILVKGVKQMRIEIDSAKQECDELEIKIQQFKQQHQLL